MELKLAVIGGKQAGKEIPIRGPTFLIGRGEECQLRPQNHLVSRKHCAIVVGAHGATIEDFGSTNGTFVNDERIQQRRDLQNGDHLKVAGLEFEVRLKAPVAQAAPKAPAQPAQKAPVEEVQKALPPTARKIGAAAKFDDDLEISSWLTEDDEADNDPASTTIVRPAGFSAHDTVINHKPSDDTTTLLPVQPGAASKDAASKDAASKDKEKDVKKPQHFKVPPKPLAENSRVAAEEMLRQFFPRKKP